MSAQGNIIMLFLYMYSFTPKNLKYLQSSLSSISTCSYIF